jgi:hypothetical protein
VPRRAHHPDILLGGPNPHYSMDKCCTAVIGTAGYRCYWSAAFPLCGNRYAPPLGQPALKSYRQLNEGWPANSWEVTEPSTGYQAQYIRVWLERIPVEWNIFGVGNTVCTFLRGEAVEYVADGIPQCGNGLSGDLAQERLEFGEGLPDGIEGLGHRAASLGGSHRVPRPLRARRLSYGRRDCSD